MLSFEAVRKKSLEICSPLEPEDYIVQPFPYVSPPKWHLGHTTWFFERFCLQRFFQTAPVNENFNFVFNSYYESQGDRVTQPQRGSLSRPTLQEVLNYRRIVDSRVMEVEQGFIHSLDEKTRAQWTWSLQLGLHHEQQHQELLYMDIKSILFHQPGKPQYKIKDQEAIAPQPKHWITFPEGVYEIGHSSDGFAFDNESPRHKIYCTDFKVSQGLVTNGEYLEFIKDHGYERADIWLSDGWRWIKTENIQRPLYWFNEGDDIFEYTLQGVQPLELHRPVTHVSYFEADAFARWKKCRLPTEAEWEVVFAKDERHLVWQWTQSSYLPYPGYRTFPDDFAEYNGKFMNGQMVLKGGCEATPKDHYRSTYRNYYQPEQRWHYSGIRLAK